MTEKAIVAKRYLSAAYWANLRIDGKLRQVQTLRSMATRVTQQFGGETISHSRNLHSMEDTIVKLIDLEKQIDACIDRLIDTRTTIKIVIEAVPDKTEQFILELRYESFCTWPEICTMVRLGHSQVFKRHAQALETVYDILLEKGLLDEDT